MQSSNSDEAKSVSSDSSDNNVNVDEDRPRGGQKEKTSENEEVKEKGEKKKLVGIFEEAEKDNPYGANYKMIAEGDTGYTYFWLSGELEDDKALVGKKVEIDIEYQGDGTFIILSGPTEVK